MPKYSDKSDHWIQKAVKHHGALKKKAQAAGQSTAAFAKAHQHDKGTTGAQARLAMTLGRMPDMPKDAGGADADNG